MTLTPENDTCVHCGKRVPDGLKPDVMSEVVELKDILAWTRGRFDEDLRNLELRLNQNFNRMGKRLESIESRLHNTASATLRADSLTEEQPAVPELPPLAKPQSSEPPVAVAPTVAVAHRPPVAPIAVTATPVPPPPPAKPKPAAGLAELHFGQKWLLIIGIIIMVLGLGYFLKYSFDQNWIGPAGRVALAYLAGIICLGAGEVFRRKEMYRYFGFALMGGGIAILYFSGFAAFHIYSLISQPVAFGLLVAVTVLAGALANVHRAQWMAILGLIGGFATPLILSTGTDNQIVLMTYLAVLNLTILALARLRAWRLLTTLAFAFTWLLFTGWFVSHYVQEKFWVTTFFLNLFYVIHFLAPVAYSLRRDSQITTFAFATSLPNAFIAFGFSQYTISRHASIEYVGIITLAYALMAVALAWWLYRRRIADQRPFVMAMVQGLLFLIITVPVIFSRHWITVFWAAQAATLIWAARRVGRPNGGAWIAGGALILLAMTLGKLYAYDYATVFGLTTGLVYEPGFAAKVVERWLTIGVALAALPATAVWLPTTAAWRSGRPILLGLFAILLFVSLNLETAAWFGEHAPAARFAAMSVLWGVYAAALLILGFVRNSSLLRKAGIGLFGCTIAKVFLVDMAHISTPFRIISFVVLGVLLIGASFLYYYGRDRLLRAIQETQKAPPQAPDKPTAKAEDVS